MTGASPRPGEAARETVMRHTSMTRPRCDEVLDAFADAVRDDEREKIARALHVLAERWHNNGDYHAALTLAADFIGRGGDLEPGWLHARLARDPAAAQETDRG